MTLGPRAIHPAPIPAESTPNLLSSVPSEPGPSEGRWTNGIAYQPYRYGTDGSGSLDPCGPLGENTKATVDPPAEVTWDPYVIWTSETCSTLGTDLDALDSRARVQLKTQTSHLIEEILWTGTVDGADYTNTSLSDADLPTSAVPAYGSIYTPNAYVSYPIVTAFTLSLIHI